MDLDWEEEWSDDIADWCKWRKTLLSLHSTVGVGYDCEHKDEAEFKKNDEQNN